MAGHSHWAGIKRKKEITDKKRGQIFSKLLKAISIVAKIEPNPQFNPTLRAAIDKAKESQVPQDNIDRAIKRASEAAENLEELLIEAYGPEGAAILIEAITDSRNRTVSEIKKILKDHDAKWADQGSVLWAFAQNADQRRTTHADGGVGADSRRNFISSGESNWYSKFPQQISEEGKQKLKQLIEALDDHDDVQAVITNIK